MKIMLIDDDIEIAKALKTFILIAGYTCETFQNPVEGISAYKSGDFDLVITDIRMPEMNGIEVLSEIKAYNPKAYVIIMTGFADVENAIEANNKGCYCFLRKPFDTKMIRDTLARIKEELSEKKRKNDSLVRLCIEYGNLEKTFQSREKLLERSSEKEFKRRQYDKTDNSWND